MRPASTLLLLAAVAAGCGNDPVDPEPSAPVLASVSGNGQTADVSTAVANPLVVRVTQDGSPLSGRSVSWSVTAGGGSVNPTTSTTNASGEASTTWTLGGSAGTNTVQASVSGATGSPVSFTATGEATGPPPTTASVSVTDNLFTPSTATIAAGGTVTWTWNGAVNHNVTFATGPNSATQASGTFARTFASAGSFDYQCTIHGAAMSGTIVVQ